MNIKIIVIVLSIILTACKTTSSTGDTQYSTFFTPAQDVEELIRTQAYDQASEVYEKQRAFFNDPKSTNTFGKDDPKIVAAKLADRLTTKYRSGADEALSSLENIAWPVDSDDWDKVKETLKNVNSELGDIKEHEILTEVNYKPDYLEQLESQYGIIVEKIRSAASGEFQKYDVTQRNHFVKIYPIELDARKFFEFQSETWISKTSTLDPNDLENVYARYKKDLPETIKSHFSSLYFQSRLKNNSNQSKLNIILESVVKAREIGLPIAKIPDSSIALIEVTSRTLLNEGQIEFPTSVDIDLPFNAHKLEVDTAFSSPVAKTADIIILLDIAAARTEREISKQEQVTSKFQIRTKTEPNPQYSIAQNVVNNARLSVQQAAMNSMSVDSQYCYGAGCLGKAISQIAAAVGQKKAEDELNQAMSELQSTSKSTCSHLALRSSPTRRPVNIASLNNAPANLLSSLSQASISLRQSSGVRTMSRGGGSGNMVRC